MGLLKELGELGNIIFHGRDRNGQYRELEKRSTQELSNEYDRCTKMYGQEKLKNEDYKRRIGELLAKRNAI